VNSDELWGVTQVREFIQSSDEKKRKMTELKFTDGPMTAFLL